MNRRQFLGSIGVGATTVLAGCGGGDGDDGTTAADGGDGPTPGSGETTTDAPAESPADGGTATTTGSDSSTTTGPDTSTATGGTPTETTGGPTLGELEVAFENSFRFRVDYSDFDEQPSNMVVEGEWNAGDVHSEMTYEGQTVEMYTVDGTTYVIAQGECLSLDQLGGQIPDPETDEWAGTDDRQADIENWSDLAPAGQTTIDGESVWIYAVDAGERGTEYPVTYYLSTETGRLRRVEVQGVVVDYWDWGTVGPIDAPC